MKTILYNPIFINPQAYYVFPQLYDIEKGDQFIEPAIYSGYLLIEDLVSNTSSQVTDTEEVDFTQFAGKRIRISQYTNMGAVVLGEWILPEGEPSGPSFHQSLVDAWFMSGPSNSDKPSSITGVNGNEIQLKNFAYSLSSGFGKYAVDFNSWANNTAAANFTKSDSVIHLTEIKVAGSKFLQTSVDTIIPSFKVKAEGITDDIKLRYVSYAEDGTGTYTYLKNGINNLPISYKKYTGFAASVVGTCNITITQLPSAYEGALVFDGMDDYGICTGLPILDDYTVVCKRVIENTSIACVISKSNTVGKGEFIYELFQGIYKAFSFGEENIVTVDKSDNVTYQTKTNYNGQDIKAGTSLGSDKLFIGRLRDMTQGYFLQGAIYYFALYNKSLTPEEIETEKERLNEEWLKRKN